MELHRLPTLGERAHTQVQQLDEERKAHRKVDVALGDSLVKPVQHQRKANQQQEAERQHLDGWVALDERADRPSGDQHDAHRDGHGPHHHPELVHHSHRRNARDP
jgi:hypothetical protein